MSRTRAQAETWLVTAILLCACTPALNWRQVDIAGVSFLLPCKPDHAEREVQLAGQHVRMQMLGCPAQGALFAISHMHLDHADSAPAVVSAWRRAALTALHAPVHPADGAMTPVLRMEASGTNTDGAPLIAHWAWWVRGADVYHLAVYGPTWEAEMTEPFMGAIGHP